MTDFACRQKGRCYPLIETRRWNAPCDGLTRARPSGHLREGIGLGIGVGPEGGERIGRLAERDHCTVLGRAGAIVAAPP